MILRDSWAPAECSMALCRSRGGVENLAENFPRGTLQALFSLRTLEELKGRAAQSTQNPQTLRLSPT